MCCSSDAIPPPSCLWAPFPNMSEMRRQDWSHRLPLYRNGMFWDEVLVAAVSAIRAKGALGCPSFYIIVAGTGSMLIKLPQTPVQLRIDSMCQLPRLLEMKPRQTPFESHNSRGTSQEMRLWAEGKMVSMPPRRTMGELLLLTLLQQFQKERQLSMAALSMLAYNDGSPTGIIARHQLSMDYNTRETPPSTLPCLQAHWAPNHCTMPISGMPRTRRQDDQQGTHLTTSPINHPYPCHHICIICPLIRLWIRIPPSQ